LISQLKKVNETETFKISIILPQIEKISIHPQRLFWNFQLENSKISKKIASLHHLIGKKHLDPEKYLANFGRACRCFSGSLRKKKRHLRTAKIRR